MLNIAYSIDSRKPFESAVLMRKNYTEATQNINVMPKDVQADKKFSSEVNGTSKELVALIEKGVNEGFIYARYWHGYLIILRPLLTIFNYNIIRLIFSIATIVLAFFLIYRLYVCYSKSIAIVLAMTLTILDFWFATICINSNICFIISLICSNIILYKKKFISDYAVFFFIIGILTNFFDLLTNPILTLGLPLTIYFIRYNEKEEEIKAKEKLQIFIKSCLGWIMGYGLFWFIKWIICDSFFNLNIIKNSIMQIFYRTNEQKIPIIALAYKISLHCPYVFYIYSLVIGICMILIIRNKSFNKYIEYIGISILPILWMIVLKNHSIIHHFFTYRNILISIFAISIILIMNIKEILNKYLK